MKGSGMKFIRDIIDEKRRMDISVHRTPVASAAEEELESVSNSVDSQDTAMAEFAKDMIEDIDDLSEVRIQASIHENDDERPADLGVSDDVAKFFERTDEPHDLDATPAATELSAPGWQASASDDPESTEAKMNEAAADNAPNAHEKSVEPSRQTKDDDNLDEISCSLKEVFTEDGTTDERHNSEPDSPRQAVSLTRPVHMPQEQATESGSTSADFPPPDASASPPLATLPGSPSAQAEPVTAPATGMSQHVEVPQPAVGRGASRHGRVKTRLLGFNTLMETETDPMAGNVKASAAPCTSFPVGWLVVVEGVGRGSAFTLFQGVSTIGRGEKQTVRLDFGDNSISREAHASIAYDARQQGFYIGHGGKTNIVRRNDRPVLCTEEIAAGDHITIGETTLRFVPFCGPDFSWEQKTDSGKAYAKQG